MKPTRTTLAALASLLLVAAPAPAEVTTVSGIDFRQEMEAGEVTLGLCSASLLRKWFFDVYVTGLYLRDCSDLSRPLSDVAKRLEIAYLRGFSASQFAAAADGILERTFASETLAPLRDRIARMNEAYRSVEAGDRYALTYRPGAGTELALNGRPLVLVPGADFAEAYFAIWLGPEPADEGLRDDLLNP